MKRLAQLFAGLSVSLAFVAVAWAGVSGHRFSNIDGGQLAMDDWAGRPVLVVNTASQCAYTPQYAQLQTLYDRYKARGLVVLAVPSDDFRQELGSAAEVKEFCELTFGLDMPMTDITHVTGALAHPFYAQVRDETGFEPRWNFHKVLIGPEGQVAATWGSGTRPLSPPVIQAIEALLD
ncbi:glutathione peroxidase [Pseudosulfitobacter sp. DSM 107133]|uniref:glutathione peroxidase n=1 Tax=Pseudosulfitobacter sp. DSM 107133 TaxID=2883100 RepID=UPI000DF1D729|nr:glutathione peroxidase [Pseudosulfitobacter sp. DSM 107133]UOA25513.1 Hydroperoxy fatty acid reductase gpx1 [Pseudosulfitobacter sp. DSM 107133]